MILSWIKGGRGENRNFNGYLQKGDYREDLTDPKKIQKPWQNKLGLFCSRIKFYFM
jgi:hypothetical protein